MTAETARDRLLHYRSRADQALRCAWLRSTATELFEVEAPGVDLGAVAANLRDLADLIEVADREGWWTR